MSPSIYRDETRYGPGGIGRQFFLSYLLDRQTDKCGQTYKWDWSFFSILLGLIRNEMGRFVKVIELILYFITI